MDDVFLNRSKDPLEHVIEMDADVRRNAAGLVVIALPGGIVPLPPGSDVCQIDVIDLVGGTFVHFFLERDDAVMKTELQDIVCILAGFFLYFHQLFQVPRIQYDRLLANHVRAQAQAITDKCVMGIIRRADRQPVDIIGRSLDLAAETVELLLFREEGTIGERAVQPSHAVELVISGHEVVTRVSDRFQVAGCDITRGSDQCKISHSFFVYV